MVTHGSKWSYPFVRTKYVLCESVLLGSRLGRNYVKVSTLETERYSQCRGECEMDVFVYSQPHEAMLSIADPIHQMHLTLRQLTVNCQVFEDHTRPDRDSVDLATIFHCICMSKKLGGRISNARYLVLSQMQALL